MEHAESTALDALEELLVAIRRRPGVQERRRGYFYRKGRALVHFHQDGTGLFADLHEGPGWRRFRVSAPDEQTLFIAELDATIRQAG